MAAPLLPGAPSVTPIGPLVGGGPTAEVIPNYLAAGKYVHYYPREGEAIASSGVVVPIISVATADSIIVTHGGAATRAVRGGVNGQERKGPGTFEPLDFRHRRHFRLHLNPHAQDFVANLEADPALVTLWRDTYKVDVDLIIQGRYDEIPGQAALFAATVDRYRALGFNVNFGFLPVAARHSDPTDGAAVPNSSPTEYGVQTGTNPDTYAVGLTSTWLNRDFWTSWAGAFTTIWEANKTKLNGWYHNQMECAFISQAIADYFPFISKTQADLKYAMQPFLDVITNTGLKTIVRPFGVPQDWAFELIVAAGAPGSVWCHEGTNTASRRRRLDEDDWKNYIGLTAKTLATIRQRLPADSMGVPLKCEQVFRMGGAPDLEDPFTESDTYCIYEVFDLTEAAGRAAQIGKEAWRQYTTRTAAIAGGTKQPSLNDVLGHWTVSNRSVVTVDLSRCYGTGRGTPNQTSISSWLRKSNGTSVVTDTIDNSRPLHSEGLMTPALDGNAWRGWIIGGAGTFINADPANSSVAYDSFLNYFTARLPSVAPAPGVTWGIWCIASGNAHAVNLVWDGTSGQLKLNVRASVGQETFTYYATPVPGATYRFVLAYDRNRDGSATGKWWTPAGGWVAPAIVKNSTTVAPVIGGAHDLLNRGGNLLGIPGMLIPFGTDVGFWKRPPTNLEMTCVNTVTFTLTPTAANSTVYSGTVDGVVWTYTSDSSATLAEVLAGIAAAIDAQTTATVTNTGTTVTVVRDGWLDVTRDNYLALSCARTTNRWPYGYNND